MKLRRPLVLLALGTCAAAAVALAQGPIWHEYVPDVEASEASALVSGGAGAEPTAIIHDGELLTAPEGGALRTGERAMRATPGDGTAREEEGRRSAIFRPDRVTALPGSIGYYEVFTPSIRPYKRVTALDAIVLDAVGVPILTVGEPGRRARVAVEGAAAPPPDLRPRDRFWGSVVCDFSEGREVPLPSVSPEARILTLRTEPVTALRVERDPADNFFVVLEPGAQPSVPVRIVFLTDAPRTYFGLEHEATLPTSPAEPPSASAPAMPPTVRADALAFARDLALAPGQPFDRVVGDLAEHFRAFEESDEPPANTGNVFVDLARGMRGVCRHRAYAFVITALALGVQARFVQNEAHAWAEVRAPEHRGWIRVDLGGSAAGLEEHRADRDAPDYRPDVVDPFPQPAPYRRALEAAALASLAEAERRATAADADAAGTAAASANDESGEASSAGAEGAWHEVEEAAADAPRPTPTGGAAVPRRPLELRIDGDGSFEVLRGSTLAVSGVATSDGAPAAGVRIEVVLVDRARGRERLLEVTVTRDNGVFSVSPGVPPDTRPDEYELVVRSPGSSTLSPAIAR